jgi:hypothetical protein
MRPSTSPRRRGDLLERGPAREPGARTRPRAGLARAPAGGAAARAHRVEADDRRGRRARQDDHHLHARPRAARARRRARVPHRRHAVDHGAQRGLGGGGVARGRGRRVRPLHARARGRDRRGDQRRARSSRDLRLAAGGREVFRAFLSRAPRAVLADDPAVGAPARGSGGDLRPARPAAGPAGPGEPQPAQRRGRARGAGPSRASIAGGPPRPSRASPARVAASRSSGARRPAPASSTTTRTTRRRSPRPSPPRAR